MRQAVRLFQPTAHISDGHSSRSKHTASPSHVRHAAESGSELSCRLPRPRSRKAATVSASALALHLGCSRAYIGKLEAEGVIERQGDGFPLDQSRVGYLRYLRRERRQSPRAEADAEHAAAKAALLCLRIAEKQRELVPRANFDAVIADIAGVVFSHLSGMAARCSNDLAVRRKIDAVVYEVRKEIAKVPLTWLTTSPPRWSSSDDGAPCEAAPHKISKEAEVGCIIRSPHRQSSTALVGSRRRVPSPF